MRIRAKPILANAAIVAISISLCLLIGEVVVRAVFNPADYLSVGMAQDKILGAVPMKTGSSQFDAWGYRNRAVPDSVDIVAIGDSHTYGNTATMDDSWPYVLGRLSGKRVYNLALGGYGPNQYFQLFRTKALLLKPSTVVVGLYMGDDFENAYLITYGLEHWSNLRALPEDKVDFDIWEPPTGPPSWHKGIRLWLSRNSVLYQLVFHGPLLGNIQGRLQIQNAKSLSDSAVSLSVPERNILEAFRPIEIARNVDTDNKYIQEGMRITFELLAEMNSISRDNNIRFVVAVIPTKEMVFSNYLENNEQLPLHDVLAKLIASERVARAKTFQFLSDSNIEFVDVLPDLQRNVEKELYGKSAVDMHPNRNGYRIIGEAVFAALNQAK